MDMDGKTVVVADDDRFIVDSIEETLKGSKFNLVGSAANGIDLVKLCEEKRPDIAIVDIQMPVKNGIEATGELVERDLAKCVIVLTSFDDMEFVSRAIDAGASGYLTKPIDKSVLIPTIEKMLVKSGEIYDAHKKVANLNKRIETREIIEKAQLLLMEKHKMSEADAYGYIKGMSKERNWSMAKVAEVVISKYGK